MCDQTYNGWTNRETWAFHLWIRNEQTTAAEAQLVVEQAAARACPDNRDDARRIVVDALREWWSGVIRAARDYGYSAALATMRDEVGSLWRVDWAAIADAMLDEEQSR